MQTIKSMLVLIGAAGILFGFSILAFLKEDIPMSTAERRVLAGFPEADLATVISGEFMDAFEGYAQDQFPFREGFRRIKAMASRDLFFKQDNNGIYYEKGYLSKLDYPLKSAQQAYALERMQELYETWIRGNGGNHYFSIVPDKNFYLAGKQYPAMDYEVLFAKMREATPYLTFIDITDCLKLEDYYYTDTHWRQEKLLPVASRLLEKMGRKWDFEYQKTDLDVPFYGVYTGQSALPVKPDQISYLTNGVLEGCLVTGYDTGKPVEKKLYEEEKLKGNDAYDFFLGGAQALLVIKNPHARETKELIVFRDSFGSSLIPLLVPAYSGITVIDARYISGELLGEYVSFENKDVLFLYSTLLLNNSMGMK